MTLAITMPDEMAAECANRLRPCKFKRNRVTWNSSLS